jgi:hypothetical protein
MYFNSVLEFSGLPEKEHQNINQYIQYPGIDVNQELVSAYY